MKAIRIVFAAVLAVMVVFGLASTPVGAKETVKVGFIGPLTGGTSSNGLGRGWLVAGASQGT